VLPALTAALVGAVAAGAATLISTIGGPSSADAANVALSAADAQNRHGGLSRPDNRMASGSSGSADQGRGDTDSTSKDKPTSNGSTKPSNSSGPARTRESEESIPTTSEPAQDGVEDEVVDLVNAQRSTAGCDPLTTDPKLAQAAQDHSTDMAERDYFDHTTPEGLTFADRIVNAGYPTPGAENIAVGQQNADQVMDGWMNSDGHRANILNCDLKSIGVGLAQDGMYWTQDFGY
jgi:uncharacterized protein YkwD